MVKRLHNSDTAPSFRDSGSLLERLFELAVLLTASMESGLAERGLTRARAELLWRLDQQPAMTQRVLSQALRCTPRNVTDLVDALEAGGLVARVPHPTDRRATLVRLTRDGKTEVARMQAGYQSLAATLFTDLAPSDLSAFASVLDQMVGHLRQSPVSDPVTARGMRGRRP